MTKKIRSARGDMVDFDLIKIKQQMASTQEPSTVKSRTDFIDNKLKRRVKKRQLDPQVTQDVATGQENVAFDEDVVSDDVVKDADKIEDVTDEVTESVAKHVVKRKK